MSRSESPNPGPPMDMSGVVFEQLDTMIRVTTVPAWALLATLFSIGVGSTLFAALFWVPMKVHGEGILLIKQDRLSQVRSLGTGRLVRLDVGLGDTVKKEQSIGEISQEDIKDSIRETEARLVQLRNEDRLLGEFEKREQVSHSKLVNQLREAIKQTIANAEEGLSLADQIVAGSLRLRKVSNLSNLEYFKDLQQKYTVQSNYYEGVSKRAEVNLTEETANNQRRRAQLQRGIEIARLEMKLKLDRDKLERTSQIRSHVEGTVTQILTVPDEFVREGTPVVLLSSPKHVVPGTDDAGKAYDSVIFVPAGEGKKVNLDDFVEVMPATVKREEHGYIHGWVVAVSELPATRRAMDAALQHPDLVEAFMRKYAPGVLLRVHVKLEEAARPASGGDEGDADNRFVWSTASGGNQRLKTGTMCEAAVVVKQQRLIQLVLPWLRNRLGID